jgi:hypothetical protein
MQLKSIILILTFLVLNMIAFGQSAKPIVSIPAYNIIYRAYPNEVEFDNLEKFPNLKIVCENVVLDTIEKKIEGTENEQLKFVLKPLISCSAKFIFLDSITEDIIDVKEFRVTNLPAPEIELVGIQSNKQISLSEIALLNEMKVSYPSSFPIETQFEILSWQLSFIVEDNHKSFEGKGNKLSSEVKRELKFLAEGNKITILVKYEGASSTGYSAFLATIVE